MAERYTKKYKLEQSLYSDAAPVLITAGALLNDNITHKTLVQLRFRSLSDKEIKSLRIIVTPAFSGSAAKPVPVEYTYTELSAERDSEFGQKSAIVMPSDDIDSFEAAVAEVVFADDSSWDGTASVWSAIRSPRTLAEALGDEETAKQYSIRYGSDCTMFPEEERGLWFCTCGAINRKDEEKCHSCRRIFSALKNINIASLRSDSIQRVEAEKIEDTESSEKKASRRKKLIIALAIAVPVLIALIAVLCTVPRNIEQRNSYETAVALLQDGKYDEAEAAFLALGNYGDSAEKAAKDVPYARAMYIMDCAEKDDVSGLLTLGKKRSDVAEGETVSVALYREAIPLFEALGNYRDSAAMVEKAQAAIDDYFSSQEKAAYANAEKLFDEGRYCAARDAFKAMGDYDDSAEMAKECMYQRAMKLYELTDKYYTNGIVVKITENAGEKSVFYIPQDVYTTLGSSLSADIRDILKSDGVEINIQDAPETGYTPISMAVSQLFEELGDYKDSKDMIQKAIDTADYTRPFFDMCSSGDIINAYKWLQSYSGEFENRDAWLALLQMYAPYCASWQFYQGDPSLIAQSLGMELQCITFTSKVIIDDNTAHLVLYPDGNQDYYLDLTATVGSTGFMYNADGVNIYYAVISNLGRFTFTKYNSLGMKIGNQSCEYSNMG